jgi:hypothetical protein
MANYPTGDFIAPLDTSLYLSANFGAIRGNHFHSGLDIRTFGHEGLKVQSIADGYVSRIKISPWGYGRALYITHPNGYTSVYGHLQTFSDEINAYVKKQQYSRKSFAIDVYPGRNTLKVSQGDLVAISGNSGGSTGPHLHFEIRDSKTEETINPQLFNLPVKDKYSPRFRNKILVYQKDNNHKHLKGYYPHKEIRTSKLKDTLKLKPGTYSFAAWADDYTHTQYNKVGINFMQVTANGKTIFNMNIERFAFYESRKINTHIDYHDYKTRSRKWHKCFADDGNTLPFYNSKKHHFINITEGEKVKISIKTFDLAGHSDSIVFVVLGDEKQKAIAKPTDIEKDAEYVYPNKTNTFSKNDYSFTIPKWAVYDTIVMSATTKYSTRKDLYAKPVKVMKTDIPLHKKFTIKFKPNVPKGVDTKKLIVVRVSGKGLRYRSNIGGKYSNGWISAKTKKFGTYSVSVDTIPPVVSGYRKYSTSIRVKITDNLSGVDTYNAYIDGNWWLMEMDGKTSKLKGILPKDLAKGKHEFKIVVTDERNNVKTFTKTFIK